MYVQDEYGARLFTFILEFVNYYNFPSFIQTRHITHCRLILAVCNSLIIANYQHLYNNVN